MLGVLYRASRAGAGAAGGVRQTGFNIKGWTSQGLNLLPVAVATAAGAGAACLSIASIDRTISSRLAGSWVSAAWMTWTATAVSCAAMTEPATTAESSSSIPLDKLACHRVSTSDARRQERPQPVVLVSCGSFNPPTIAHLKILEMVREAYIAAGVDVYGAYLSPVHDEYKKKGLIAARHRVEMCRLAVGSSSFVMVDSWEAAQAGYTRTLHVLDSVDARLRDAEKRSEVEGGTEEGDECDRAGMPRTVLVCGADVLESMAKPDVWDQVLLEQLLRRHGVACVVRRGTDIEQVLQKEGTLVSKWREHIMVVEAGEGDMALIGEVSSTRVREACRAGGCGGLEGLVDDQVRAYIMHQKLFSE